MMLKGSTPSVIEEVHGVGRRTFLKYALGFSFLATAAGIVIPVVGYIWPPSRSGAAGESRVLVGTTKDLPPGRGKVFPVNDKPVMVVNTSQGVKAFSAICTHLGCICEWDQGRNIILCPCHDGRFNPVTGDVISGPPPRPLSPVAVSVEGENIYVGGGA